ncbi:hypothetical protein ACFQ07_02495 [Actinomadura adrarensis]|uniref:Uncharacterized protein n=1 Tax=Actinomadura adrarensis TaxID=1819600 RepID=A0ABW3C9E9_9ACTN
MEFSTGDVVATVVFGLLLVAGFAQGVLAYTGRWRSWFYWNNYLNVPAIPVTVFWASSAGLCFYLGMAVVLNVSEMAGGLIIMLLAFPQGLLAALTLMWVPPFARPRWVEREEARLLGGRGRAD